MLPHPLLPADLQSRYLKQGLWRDEDLYRLLVERAGADPDRPLYLEPEVVSYGEAAERAGAVARRLLAEGVRPGEAVVAPLVNGPVAAVVSAAVAAIGAILAPLPSRATPAQVLRLAAALAAPAVVASGRVLARSDWDAAFLERWTEEAPSVRVLLLADAPDAPGWAVEGIPALESAAAGSPSAEFPAVDGGSVGLLLSTGGTTGAAKLVAHRHTGVAYAARQYAEAIGLKGDDRVLQVGPFGHASGTIFTLYTPILAGAAIVPLAAWSPSEFAAAAERTKATWTLLSGTHVHDLLTLPSAAEAALGSLRGMSAGSGSDLLFGEAERRFGIIIRRMYGLTECLGNSIMPADTPGADRMTRDGLAFAGTEHRVVSVGGVEPVSPGEPGEMLVRGPSLFSGYHGRPELTSDVVDKDGWFRTGDLMEMDGQGFIKYVGRLKDVIRRGGVNIDPLEVERALVTHPAIADVAVVGMPDDRLGERPAAVVVTAGRAKAPTLADLLSYLAQREVPPAARPEFIFTVDALPKTEFGKHDKVALRALLSRLPPAR